MPLDQKFVRHLVHEQFPELPCDEAEMLGEGMDCSAWLIDGRCVFRFPKRETGAECLQNEIRVLPLIAGRSVCDVSIPDSAASKFARSLATFLKKLHSISVEEARQFDAPADGWRRLDVAFRCDFAGERLQQAEKLGSISNTSKWLSRLEEIEAASPLTELQSLVHGDLYSKHVLIDEDFQLTGIIDWGDVHIGHPAVDLATLWNTVPAAGRDAFLEEYGPIDEATWQLAQLRVIYHSVATLLFAIEIDDQALASHSRLALQAVFGESRAG